MGEAMSRPRRNFDPRKTARYGIPTFDPDKLVKYSPKWQYQRLFNFPFRGSHWRPRMLTVVIDIHGGAKPNNRDDPNSIAAYGVFFGPGCHRNRSGLLNPSIPQTNTRAELEAVNQALAVVIGMAKSQELTGWHEIIIRLNSEYVAKALSDYVWVWEENGYTKSDGGKVQHSKAISNLHATICKIEEELGMAVRFWRLGKEWIEGADALVKQAMRD